MTTTEIPHPADGGPPACSMLDAPLPAYESHSSISTYTACPLRYAYRYVERRPGEVSPGQFAFGNAVHRAFEAFVRERIRARADCGAPAPGREVLQAALDRKLDSCGTGARRGHCRPAPGRPRPRSVPGEGGLERGRARGR